MSSNTNRLSDGGLEELVGAIHARPAAVIPPGSEGPARGSMHYALDALVGQPGDLEYDLLNAVRTILEDTQTAVVRDLKEPWPTPVGERHEDPLLWGEAELSEGELRL